MIPISALQAKAKKITDEMKLAAAYGLASMIPDDKIREDYIIVSAFEKNVADRRQIGRASCRERV